MFDDDEIVQRRTNANDTQLRAQDIKYIRCIVLGDGCSSTGVQSTNVRVNSSVSARKIVPVPVAPVNRSACIVSGNRWGFQRHSR